MTLRFQLERNSWHNRSKRIKKTNVPTMMTTNQSKIMPFPLFPLSWRYFNEEGSHYRCNALALQAQYCQDPERLPCLRTRIAIPSLLRFHSSVWKIDTRFLISFGVRILRARRTFCLWVIILLRMYCYWYALPSNNACWHETCPSFIGSVSKVEMV
jgi:hypothetical protein